MRTLTLTLDDSPEAALFLALVRGASFITAVQEKPTADAEPELPLIWPGYPTIDPFGGEPLHLRPLADERVLPLVWAGDSDVTFEDIFGGEPIILRPLSEIRRDWDKRPPLKFPLPAAADDKDDDGDRSV